MGAWGTAVSSNDTYADIYGTFFDLYNDGLDVLEISKKLIVDNQEVISDPNDCNNFWFALAKAQWECKQLDEILFDRVKEIVETNADLDVWRHLDVDENEVKKRKIALDKFLSSLQTVKPKAKARKKKIIRQPPFAKGDCLTFKLSNGNFGGAVVLEAIKDTEYGHNLIATTRINQQSKPTKNEFENADILVMNYASWDNKPNVNWYFSIRHKHVEHLIEKVETIEVQLDYDIKNSRLGFMGDFEIWVIEVADEQFKSEETKPRSNIKKTIKELTKQSKWKLW